MNAYSLTFTSSAHKIFKKLPKPIQDKLLNEAKKLKIDPFLGLPLKGKHKFLRSLHLIINGTAYRIIYQPVVRTKLIIICLATTRENIYKRLDKMKIKPN